MAAEMLERDDLSVYVVAGLPRSFKRDLQQLVEQQAGEKGDVVLVDPEMSEWLLARLREEKRPNNRRTPASQALWRAYSALSAARYHLQHDSEEEERVRLIRSRVEELWRELSPMFSDEPESAAGA